MVAPPARAARRGARRLRLRDHRHHPRLLPGGARRPRRARRHRVRHDVRGGRQRPARRGRRRPLRPPLRPPRRRRSSAAREAMEIARGGDRQPGRADRAGRRARRPDRRDAGAAGRRRPRRARGAQAPHGRHDLRRPADAPAATRSRARAARSPRRGCARATASCSSTSSRTPTPCSGRSCGPRSATARSTLVLIGDPKQAIYAFRGADVYAYIEAARTAGARGHADDQLAQRPGAARRLRRAVRRREARARGDRLPPGRAPRTRRRAPARRAGSGAAADPGRPARRRRPDPAGLRAARARAPARRPRRRRRHRLAAALGRRRSTARARSARATSPCSCGRTATRRASATRWRRSTSPPSSTAPAACSAPSRRASGCALLEAIERPSYPPRARSAALTTFLGWTTERVAEADDDAWEGVHRRLHHWARVLREKGVASLMEAITLEEGLPERVLAMVDGERRMTDLRHVGELLHAAAMTEQMGATALTAWLRAAGARGRRPTTTTRSAAAGSRATPRRCRC